MCFTQLVCSSEQLIAPMFTRRMGFKRVHFSHNSDFEALPGLPHVNTYMSISGGQENWI